MKSKASIYTAFQLALVLNGETLGAYSVRNKVPRNHLSRVVLGLNNDDRVYEQVKNYITESHPTLLQIAFEFEKRRYESIETT
jgi:hypothetical protein